AHAAEAGGHDEPAGQRSAEMSAADGGEGLVGALDDALTPYIYPAAGGHLTVHREAAMFEIAERLPVRPRRNEQSVHDQDTRRAGMRREDADRFAGLHEQRFVVFERPERPDDRVEGLPAARGLARSAVHDE